MNKTIQSLQYQLNSGTGEWMPVQMVRTANSFSRSTLVDGARTQSLLFALDPITDSFVSLRTLTDNIDSVAPLGGPSLLSTISKSLSFNGATYDRVRSLVDNADANAEGILGLLGIMARQQAYNGVNYDRVRNNLDQIILTSAARVTTTSSADFINYNGKGLKVFIDTTAFTATPSVVFDIEVKDPVSGVYTSLLTSVAIIGISHTVLTIYPGIAAVANVSVSDILPRTWRITATHANADSLTYSVGSSIIN